jgi:hypothetical protein
VRLISPGVQCDLSPLGCSATYLPWGAVRLISPLFFRISVISNLVHEVRLNNDFYIVRSPVGIKYGHVLLYYM